MSENSKKHHSHRDGNQEPQKMRIRVKKPREFDENGVPKPHKHVHTHSSRNTQNNETKFTYAEVSVVPVSTTDLTTLTQNTNTVTDVTNNQSKRQNSIRDSKHSHHAKDRSVQLIENTSATNKKSKHSESKHKTEITTENTETVEEKNILGDLGLESKFSETKVGKRFVKHDSGDEFYDGTAAPPSTVLETRNDSTEISETRQLRGDTPKIDFHEYLNDPYFADLQKELDYIYNEQLKLMHPELDPTLSQIVGETIDDNTKPIVEFENIHPSKLYPKSTCPAKWRLNYQEPAPELPEEEEDDANLTEVEVLVSCDPEDADFVDADPEDLYAERYVEQTMTMGGDTKTNEDDDDENLYSVEVYTEEETEEELYSMEAQR